METDPLVTMLVGGLTVAFIFGYLAQKLKFPLVFAYVAAGIVAGPHMLGATAKPALIRELADFGLVLVMFGLALRFPPPQSALFRWAAVPAVAVQTGLTVALGYLTALLLDFDTRSGLILGVTLSLSSSYLLLSAMFRPGDELTPFKALTSTWLALQSALALLVMITLTVLAADRGEGFAFWSMLGEKMVVLGAFVLALIIFARRILSGFLIAVARLRSREMFALGVFTIALCIAYAAYILFGAGFAVGVFLSGLALNQAELARRAGDDLVPFRDAVAVPFFVSLGMMIDPHIFIEEWPAVMIATAIVLAGSGMGAFLGGILICAPLADRLKLAISMAMAGEFSILIGGTAIRLELIPEALFAIIVAAAAITILLNPFARVLVARLAQRYA
ncbi:MAG: cation:proton antiporter [Hyphomicrobiales bacterium]|nr:cation:proton antiporter [Hyphomicrobiales bacterium]